MKDWTMKLKITLFYVVLFLIGCGGGGFLSRHFHLPTLAALNELTVMQRGNPREVFSGADHPYGRAFHGVLLWEHERRFQEACAAHKVWVRMAAFQTTLPDPLPGEEFNVGLAADLLAGTVVPPGKVFMMNSMLGPYNAERGFRDGPAYMGPQVIKVTGGGVCKIASTLYNVVTLANLQIVERHSHSMQVPYVPPGQDATVSTGNKDFKFRNNGPGPVLIWADTKENTLYMAIYGNVNPPAVSWRHQILNRQPYRKLVYLTRDLKPGQEKIIIPGADGLTVRSWLLIKSGNGATDYKDLGIDRYRPLNEIVERGRAL